MDLPCPFQRGMVVRVLPSDESIGVGAQVPRAAGPQRLTDEMRTAVGEVVGLSTDGPLGQSEDDPLISVRFHYRDQVSTLEYWSDELEWATAPSSESIADGRLKAFGFRVRLITSPTGEQVLRATHRELDLVMEATPDPDDPDMLATKTDLLTEIECIRRRHT